MNKTHRLFYVLVGLTCMGVAAPITASNSIHASQINLRQTISQAITQFEQTPRENWSYRVSRYENEEGDVSRSVELFSPSKESTKQWSLLRVNGQAPTEKEVQKFVRKKQKHSEGDGQNSFAVKLREIIQLETLRLISEDQNALHARFNVYLSQLGENAAKNLQGSLTFNKDQQYIETITIYNTGAFSPVFSAKITDFKLTFHFIKIDSSVLSQQHNLTMKGTFAFLTEIDEVSTDTFSDYQYMGNGH